MRIAEISAFSQFSVGKIMKDIKDYHNSHTNAVCKIFYSRGDKNESNDFCLFGNKFLVLFNALFARIFDNDGFCLKNNTKRLIKQLNRFKPDIVHIHCLHGYYLNSKLLFSYFFEHPTIKVVWTMHDAWAITGHCCYFNFAKCFKWKKHCESCPQKKEYPASYLIDNSSFNYDEKRKIFSSLPFNQMVIVTPSHWLSDIIQESFLSKYKVFTIHNGINTNVFNTKNDSNGGKPYPPFTNNKKVLLGVASVWDTRKGLSFFNEISDFIKDDWEIVVIGKIDKKTKLSPRIRHIERTTDQFELKRIYQSASVLLNPTLDDNYPTVNIEAQACGCKVLTFDTGGARETDCGNLYLAQSMNIEYLISKINEISLYPVRPINYQKIDKERMGLEYNTLFNSL